LKEAFSQVVKNDKHPAFWILCLALHESTPALQPQQSERQTMIYKTRVTSAAIVPAICMDVTRSPLSAVTLPASCTVLYRSNCTGGAMPGLGTKPRRPALAQHFLVTGLRRSASFFAAACGKTLSATHAVQNFLPSHSYQHFRSNKRHFSTSTGKV
jgi:hypothetical protein